MEPSSAGMRLSRPRLVILVALIALVGALLRLSHLNWDQHQHVHPDERFVVWAASTMSWPGDLATALDVARSPLNPYRWPAGAGELAGQPRNFAYGHLPLYLALGAANVGEALAEWLGETTLAFPAAFQPLHVLGRRLTEYNYIGLVGRALSALFDVGTLLIVFALGRRAYGAWAGVLAAAFYALSVLPVQLSRFFTVDAPLTFFVVATAALAARWADGGERRSGWPIWLAAGVMAGCAVGSKFSAILLALPLLMAAGLRARADGRNVAVAGGYFAAACVAAFAAFAVTNPFSLLEFPAFARNILAQNAMVSGVMDAPYTRQFIGTPPYLYFVQQLGQWGLGWPLGLVAWIGFGWTVIRALRQRASASEWVMLAWAVPYFVTTGLFYAKFLRYMAPLLPFLMVMGAGMLMAFGRWLSARWDRRGRLAWGALVAGVLVVTALWQVAFLGVYRQEHPWLQASRWIYSNVPEGATLLTEHWDDALPLRMDEIADRPPLRAYRQVELPLWDADTTEKLDTLAAELSRADYVVIATNRLYRPIQRLPQRYPMASKYYDLLFSGDLGYREAAEFTAYPHLGPLTIRDDNADESFTVYDHPRVMIFVNEGRLSESLLRARLGRYLPLRAGSGLERPPGHARTLPPAQDADPGDKLLLTEPVDALPVVADFRWNPLAAGSPWLSALLWWLAVSLFGVLAWPLLFPLLPGLRDRGYGLARAIGWLLVGWLHWMGVNLGLWQNRALPIALLAAALLAAAALAFWRQRDEIGAFFDARRRLLLGAEALFAGMFLIFVIFRLFNPDLWQPWNGGEKFMEIAFLNAILRSASFPPYDPYFAGGVMNYYYYGLYLVSLPIKLTGIAPEVAFNLAVPSLFALTGLGVFSVGATLAEGFAPAPETQARRARLATTVAPLLAVLLTLWMGNLASAKQTLDTLLSSRRAFGFDYWSPSRVIPYTINEFPFWTFLFADLHPHLISMPFGMAAVGLSLNLFVLWGDGLNRPLRPLQGVLNLLVLSLVVGSLGAINTWDLPTYLMLATGGLLIAGWRARSLRSFGIAALAAGLVAALSVLAYLPFYRGYVVQVGRGDGWALGRYLGWAPTASPLGDWLLVWGILLFLAGVFVTLELVQLRPAAPVEPVERPASRRHSSALFWLFLIAIMALLIALGRPTAALAAAPMLLAFRIALRRDLPPQRAFAAWLLGLGLAVIAGTELIYLRDFLAGGDWYRMNTVFKFALPAWLFLGLAGGATLWLLWGGEQEGPHARASIWRWAGQAGSLALVAAGLVFVVRGAPARLGDRFPGQRPPFGTLDGTAYMTVGEYTWPNSATLIELRPERDAIRWLLDHVEGTPVIAEAPAGGYFVDGDSVGYDYYRAGGQRVASLTGFPTFVGHHQYEQRPGSQVGPRTEQGKELFATTDLARARRLMRDLRVGYIYVGELERILFSPESLHKFDVLVENGELETVYDNGSVRIYRVIGAADPVQ